MFLFVFCGPIYCCWRICAGKPRRPNASFVSRNTTNEEELKSIDLNLFQSGIWRSQYYQYSKWHGPQELQLTFDSLQSKVTGSGSDNIGVYSINGIYSTQSRRMGLTKTYQLGTGNPLENLGHDVTIQVEWNRYNQQFEGKWYVRTNKFRGSGDFKLTYIQSSSISSIYDKV